MTPRRPRFGRCYFNCQITAISLWCWNRAEAPVPSCTPWTRSCAHSFTPMPLDHRRAYRGRGGGECSEDEDKALGMLKHMRRQIFGHPAPYVEVRGAAVSIGVNPGGSECEGLVDELLQAGYIRTYPSPSLTAHGLYRLTDRGIAAAREAAAQEG